MQAVVGVRQSTQAKPSFIPGLFRVLGHESYWMKNTLSKSDFNMAQLPFSLVSGQITVQAVAACLHLRTCHARGMFLSDPVRASKAPFRPCAGLTNI